MSVPHGDPSERLSGTYKWRFVGGPAIVAHDNGDGTKVVACPSAARDHHRLVTLNTRAVLGAVGHLRYISNYPHWGRLEFETCNLPERPGAS